MSPETMLEIKYLIAISVIWGTSLLAIAWIIRSSIIAKAAHAPHGVDSIKCPRQLCSNYLVKCHVCSRQIREDKFLPPPDTTSTLKKEPPTRYGLMCDKRFNCNCHMVACEDGTYIKAE